MKKIIITALATALLAVAVAPAAQAATPKSYLNCATGNGYRGFIAPTRCLTLFPNISHAESSGALVHLHWRNWGKRTATATGQQRYKDSDRTPITIRLHGRIRCDGSPDWYVYTLLTVRTPFGSGTQHMPGCADADE